MNDEPTGLVGMATTALPAIKTGIDLFRSAIGLAKEAKELLPDGSQKDAIQQSLAAAEKASKLAHAQIAQALGFNLCQCTFPPQIMTSKGYHPNRDIEIFECPACQKQTPSPQHFAALDRRDQRRRTISGGVRRSSWMA